MSTGDIIRQVLDKIKGLNAEMILADMRQDGLTKRKILRWQQRLREAADEMDKLL